jgi:hypothetical protein
MTCHSTLLLLIDLEEEEEEKKNEKNKERNINYCHYYLRLFYLDIYR